MTSTVFNPGTTIPSTWLNDVNTVVYGGGVLSPPFLQTTAYVAGTTGAALKDSYVNVMTLITSETERAAIKTYTTTTDHTSIINAAIAYGKRIYLPAGLWNVSTDTGLVFSAGGSMVGDGLMRTIIRATAVGGSISELASYTKGMVIKRAFTPGVANAYVTGCYWADFSIQLNHPSYNASNYKQIGIDLRNITRSIVERVHVGTLGVPGQPVCPVPSATDACQGYGIVIGTKSSGDAAYCGGEVNTVRDSLIWGAFCNVRIDDTVLSPSSGAHATVIDNCDIQGGHELCVQASQYAAGVVMTNLTVQGNYRQSGNVNPTIAVGMAGYNGRIHIKYAELGTACDATALFSSSSKNCKLDIDYYDYSGASTGTISDTGTRNYMRYPAGIGGVATARMVETYNKGFLNVFAKFYWDGSVIQVLSSYGVSSVVRNAAGNYTVNLSKNMPSADAWVANAQVQVDGSFHFGGAVGRLGSQSSSAYRFDCYSQVGGVTTTPDPSMVWFSGQQV